ncbi:fimbrial protein [Proteus myxofaciens]|uniref:Fimbrial protein n=1 Tax=Proteus myxofaciens ATCC 19692 TaxID=1354337 RepID=A0A198GNK3_9GAMM|nr:fimbrial protein [Proteus myxofaciens]OAT38673.1 hypothetical protein M983_0217 [Proteus myxofaciens ATCC 19692]
MMSKHNILVKATGYLVTLLIVGSALSQLAIAGSTVASTPVNQSSYEPLHQGHIQVNATLFNAPCNLSLDKVVRLTECGAGKDYREMALSDIAANTPVSIRFYDAHHGVFSQRHSLSLQNGDNPLILPVMMKDQHILRLEVSYE